MDIVIDGARSRLMDIVIDGTVNFTPDEQRILDSFSYHKPSDGQVDRISNIRTVCKNAALGIIANVKPSADRTAALRKVHEAMMTANKAIVCEDA